MTQKLNTQPYKGARDLYPEGMRIRNYIFDTWKKVCKSYGYEEYDFPIMEPFEIFAAKTGEEIVNEQLFTVTDRADRKLAIRPELTPGTVRMLAAKYKELQSPVRWFMIGNNWRAEKPQKGRGREFYQLEVNIFGEKGVEADFEIFQIIISIMNAFGADETMFSVSVSDRRLISALLKEVLKLDDTTATKTRRIMDKRAKMSKKGFEEALLEIGLNEEQTNNVANFMETNLEDLDAVIPQEILSNNEGYKTVTKLFEFLKMKGLSKYCRFDPSIIRGFDYSDGLVYEVTDNKPDNSRSMFGGERFDRLIEIFGDYDLAATGFAMGDWTLLEFLAGWDLLPDFDNEVDYFVTLWPEENERQQAEMLERTIETAEYLRDKGFSVATWLRPNTKLDKQLKYSNKKEYTKVVILGPQEIEKNVVTIKDMESGKQETKPLVELAQ